MAEKYGIKISQSGYDVLQEPDENLVFSSEFPTITIREKKEISVTTDSGDEGKGNNTYEHNFGYIPQMIAFTTTSDLGDTWPEAYINVPANWLDFLGDGYLYEIFEVYSDTTTVTCTAQVYSFEYVWDEELEQFVEDYTYYDKTYAFDVLLLMEEAQTAA